MKAIHIENPGKDHQLKLIELAKPSPGVGEILIKTAYAGLNRADLFQAQGNYPLPEGEHSIPGLELSGTVEAIGEGVEGLQPDDRVAALVTQGAYAEYCLAPVQQVFLLPGEVTLEQAAALPEVYATAMLALQDKAGLQSGERVLVHGGASGVGLAATKLARLMGAEVVTTAGTTEKCRASIAAGAARSLCYREQDFAEVLRNDKVDVVLDMVGGEYLEKNLSILQPGGRMVIIAFLAGVKSQVNMAPVLLNQLTIRGMTLRPQPPAVKQDLMQRLATEILPAFSNKSMEIPVDNVFSLPEVAEAHATMGKNLNIGKILLHCAA